MDLKKLSDDSNKLRSEIIASSMVSCYVILEELASHHGLSIPYQDFRRRWIELYKSVYDHVSQLKTRATTRPSLHSGGNGQKAGDVYEVTDEEENDLCMPRAYHRHHHK